MHLRIFRAAFYNKLELPSGSVEIAMTNSKYETNSVYVMSIYLSKQR